MDPDLEHDFCSSLYGELQSNGRYGWFVEATHKALERGLGDLPAEAQILEVGGNLGEHCRFVRHPYREYVVTDYRQVDFTPLNTRTRFEVADVEAMPYDDASFDRILATCVLHHLTRPEQALREMKRVVRPGGLISLTLPCDPGILYRLGKMVGPYRALKKRGMTDDPRYFHYSQHRNHYPGLVALIERVFQDDLVSHRFWPLPLPVWNSNLFTIYQIRLR
jgi:phosphatidylethanolamine/phosphatidyl-N-methylethanolamine N-methyltransferase